MSSSLWRACLLSAASVLIVSSLPASAGAQALTPEQRKSLQQIKALVQTGVSAMDLGEWLRVQEWSYPLPRTSQSLTMEVNQKVDAWGNPFCIIPIGESVAVVSGGPSHFSCDALPLTTKQIVESKTEGFFLTASKLVVCVVPRARPPWID
jgi:hypothetical protein